MTEKYTKEWCLVCGIVFQTNDHPTHTRINPARNLRLNTEQHHFPIHEALNDAVGENVLDNNHTDILCQQCECRINNLIQLTSQLTELKKEVKDDYDSTKQRYGAVAQHKSESPGDIMSGSLGTNLEIEADVGDKVKDRVRRAAGTALTVSCLSDQPKTKEDDLQSPDFGEFQIKGKSGNEKKHEYERSASQKASPDKCTPNSSCHQIEDHADTVDSASCDDKDRFYSPTDDQKPSQSDNEVDVGAGQKKKTYYCSICQKDYAKPGRYKHHMRIHTGEKPYQCHICNEKFRIESTLKTHINKHKGIKPYQCDFCGKCFAAAGSLVVHKRTHKDTGEKTYDCSVCKKSYKFENNLIRHMHCHDGKTIECPVCNRQLSSKESLKNHMRTHSTDRPYQCTTCEASFKTPHVLRNHMKSHSGKKPHECSICNKSFLQKGALKEHMGIHADVKPYQCSICGNGYTFRTSLKYHMITKHEVAPMPYHCSVCDKGFAKKAKMEQHMRKHTKEKPFQCSECGLCFAWEYSLNLHKQIHTGEKPYYCYICKKYFSRQQNWAVHMRSHKGCQPYLCSICNIGFDEWEPLKEHLRVIHKERYPSSKKVMVPSDFALNVQIDNE